jgi:hypothetical protein
MSFDTTVLGLKEKALITGYEKEILATLQKCRDKVAAGTATDALNRWFGDSSTVFSRNVKEKVAKMRSHLLNTNILCQMGVNLAADNNAQANHFTVGFVGVNSLEAVNLATTNANTFSKVMIGPNFVNLVAYAPAPVSTFDEQDQFETLVHELSHVVLGTRDEKLSSGATAYTGRYARDLVTENQGKSVTNAENWGFFIEEFR